MVAPTGHHFTHLVGSLLRTMSPRAYERARWTLTKSGAMSGLLGKPMYQELILPFAVRPGDTVLDIGANLGQFTLPLAKLVGRAGKVCAFEPVPSTCHELRANVHAAGVDAIVRVEQVALSDTCGCVELTVPYDRPTEAALVRHDAEQWAAYGRDATKYYNASTQVTTLDAYICLHALEEITFIKCDVEGAELKVFTGASAVLRGRRPPILLVEAFEGWTTSFGYRPQDLFQFLHAQAGYDFYWISENGLEKVDPTAPAVPGIFWQWVDFVGVVRDVHDRRFNVARYLA